MFQLRLPWGVTYSIESLDRFTFDGIELTAEYYSGPCNLVYVYTKDFTISEDYKLLTVRSCNVRFIEVITQDEDPETARLKKK